MKKMVLHIENDEIMTAAFRECLEDVLRRRMDGLDVVIRVARCVDDANQMLDAEDPPYDALVVDLMLPRTSIGLAEVEALEAQRSAMVRDLLDLGGHTAAVLGERAAVRAHVDDLDRQLDERVAPEGGCEVLERLARRTDPSAMLVRPLERPVVFLTARGLPEVRSRCQRIVQDRYRRFFEKPVDDVEVVDAVLDLLERPGE